MSNPPKPSSPSTAPSTAAHSGKSAATSTAPSTTSPAITSASTAASTPKASVPSSGATTPKLKNEDMDNPKPDAVKHEKNEKETLKQVKKEEHKNEEKSAPPTPKKEHKPKQKRVPCPPHLCTLVPTDVPAPEHTQAILHPRKDVFVLKVAKVGPNGDRRCRMELELVTPKSHEKTPPYRIDTRETQYDPECTCCCSRDAGRRKKQ